MLNMHDKNKRKPMLPKEKNKPLRGWLLDKQWLT
jgi:hypothetical protein